MDKQAKKELKPAKRSIKILLILIFIIAVAGLSSSFVYKALNTQDYTETYEERMEDGEIINPIQEYGLILEEIEIEDIEDLLKEGNLNNLEEILSNLSNISLEKIEEDFVYYAAVQLKLYNLQEIPFTSIKPVIQIQIDERNYSIEISEGEIFVEKGIVENPDMILKTSYEELLKMTEDESHLSESFSSGMSGIEITANKFVLFSKGYLGLYQELEELF